MFSVQEVDILHILKILSKWEGPFKLVLKLFWYDFEKQDFILVKEENWKSR